MVIQTQDLNIYNINAVVIKTQRYVYIFHHWIKKLFSEDNKVAVTLSGWVRQTRTKWNSVKLCCPSRSACLFSLLSHENKESLFI